MAIINSSSSSVEWSIDWYCVDDGSVVGVVSCTADLDLLVHETHVVPHLVALEPQQRLLEVP